MAITLEAGVGLGANPIRRAARRSRRSGGSCRCAAGEILGAFGLTEPGGGLGRGDHRTTARLDERRVGDQRLEGVHHELGHGDHRLRHDRRRDGRTRTDEKEISAIIVPSGTPGFEVGPPYRKVGWHASDTHELSFDGCRVPEANLAR